jgi:hypothetical protein
MAYTNIDDPSVHFQSYAFSKSSGTGSATFDGNSDLQPDFLWVKSRSNADSHELWDSTRGVNSTLFSDNTSAEDPAANRIVSFDTDGFTWGNAGNLNAAGDFVSWAWKANGGSTVTNTDGSANSTVQANTDAGFSILEITGTGANATYGHGLGVKPQVVLIKRTSAIGNWLWLTSVIDGTHDYLYLNSNAAQNATSYDLPTSSVFQYNDTLGATSIVYCFAEKQGFSKLGSYIGNGSSNGTFVYTGFKPSFVMIKRSDSLGNWVILDNKRDSYNQATEALRPDLPNVTLDSTDQATDFLSNGFKFRGTGTRVNGSSATYIYVAFAENPFVTSTGIPTTAR